MGNRSTSASRSEKAADHKGEGPSVAPALGVAEWPWNQWPNGRGIRTSCLISPPFPQRPGPTCSAYRELRSDCSCRRRSPSRGIRNLERISGRKGNPGALGLWLVKFARIIVQLEHRWRNSGYRSEHVRRRLLAARDNFRIALELGRQAHAGQRTGHACEALLRDEPRLWRFLDTPGLDLTNNTAERALRPYVIWRKTSFFSQSDRGDRFRAHVMTVSESCRRLDLCAYRLLRQEEWGQVLY